MMKIERRILFVLLIVVAGLALLSIFAAAQTAKARTIYVDDDGGADYTKIQDAINASSMGDTVYVYNGTYNEQITINKSINLIGENNQDTLIQYMGPTNGIIRPVSAIEMLVPTNTTTDNSYDTIAKLVIAQGRGGDIRKLAFYVRTNATSTWTKITADQSNPYQTGSIFLENSMNDLSWDVGEKIFLSESLDTGNIIGRNDTYESVAVRIVYENYTLFDSTLGISHANIFSVSIHITADNVEVKNVHIDNFGKGMSISASNSTIENNTITNSSSYSIYLYDYSNDTRILSNTLLIAGVGCIAVPSSSGNRIIGNVISSGGAYGIFITWSSSNNNITSNNICGNKQWGLYQYSGTGNTAYNNWWGDVSGPYDSISNPNGIGDNITGSIPFSPWATSPFNITVNTPETPSTASNQKPSATITSIAPNPAIYNQSVITFVGSGKDTDGTIIEYLWESNVSGIIGITATFTNSSLPAGVHKITFKVKDNNNTWSEPVSTTLTINTSGGNVSITEKPGEQKKGFIPSLDFSMIVICIIVLATIVEFRRKK